MKKFFKPKSAPDPYGSPKKPRGPGFLADASRKTREWQQRLALKREQAQYARRQAARDRDVTRERAILRRVERLRALRAALTPRMPRFTRPRFVMPRFVPSLIALIAVCSLVGNVLMYFRFTSARPLVTVGHRVFRRGEYQAALDQTAGKAVLNKMVYAELVRQAAAKANVTPTATDITARLTEMQRRNSPALASVPPDALRSEIEAQLALENLRVKDVPATEAEVQAYYNAHRRDLALPSQVSGTLVISESAADAKTAEKLLGEGLPPDAIAAHPRLHVAGINGFQVNMAAAPPAFRAKVGQTILSMQPGQITTLPAGKWFWTFRAASHNEAVLPTLEQARADVTRQVKLLKAPSEGAEIQMLYQANKPAFDMDRYAAYFQDISHPVAPKDRKTASLP